MSALDGSSNCTLATPPGVPADGAPTPENRFAQLNHAVDTLTSHPHVSVYLDATHTAWQNVGESADRLVKAGVQRAAGFYVNASNYQYTPNLAQYGAWVSKCLAYATEINPGDYNGCPNQYWNGGPSNGWVGVALNNYGVWSDTATEADLNTLGVNERYASMLGATAPTAHFVVDTSRNGQGPWKPPAGGVPGPAGLVQPAGARPRRVPDGHHRRPVDGREAVDQDARPVRRPVQPRRGRGDHRPRVGRDHRSGGRRVVPAAGAPAGPARPQLGRRRDDEHRTGAVAAVLQKRDQLAVRADPGDG